MKHIKLYEGFRDRSWTEEEIKKLEDNGFTVKSEVTCYYGDFDDGIIIYKDMSNVGIENRHKYETGGPANKKYAAGFDSLDDAINHILKIDKE